MPAITLKEYAFNQSWPPAPIIPVFAGSDYLMLKLGLYLGHLHSFGVPPATE